MELFRFIAIARTALRAFTTGVTLNEPGEQSALRFCRRTCGRGLHGEIFNGTPFASKRSAFNTGPG